MFGESNDKINFWITLLLTDRDASELREVFANNLSANSKLSKTKLCKTVQSGGFLRRRLVPLLYTGLPFTKNVFTPSTGSVLMPLGLPEAAISRKHSWFWNHSIDNLKGRNERYHKNISIA